MDWTTPVVVGLFVVACLLALRQSRTEGWPLNRKLGTSLFLVGMAVGLFLDDVPEAESSFQRLAEPMGAVVAVGGLLVSWFWRPD